VICAGVTALLAGIAGAWSPCGFSMLDTIGSALGDARRAVMFIAIAMFSVGAVVGGAATFGLLAFLGSLLGHGDGALRDALAGVLAIAAAVADWRGLRITPQISRQVPERWRWIMPLPLVSGLYGVLLGLGFTTFILSFAVWALAGISFAADSVALGLTVGIAFGIGRALPILWLAPGLGTAAGQRRLDQLGLEPRLWLGLRRLDAIGLGCCALALAGVSASATTLLASGSTDPTADGSLLAWQQIGVGGVLDTGVGSPMALPGSWPALGGGNIAWEQAGAVVVANETTLTPTETVTLPSDLTVTSIAVSTDWLVINGIDSAGGGTLDAVALDAPTTLQSVARSQFAGAIGRPQLDGDEVVYAFGTSKLSAIYEVDLATNTKTALRLTHANWAFANPALLSDRLLYEQTGRCEQRLLIGPANRIRHATTLLTLESTVSRDTGYEPGYIPNYDQASHCPNRRAGRGGKITLGATALSGDDAYVTEYPKQQTAAEIIAVPLS
jgi:hypothetical protein